LSIANTPILTPIQVKILLAMLRSKDYSLNSEAILRETGIALSTWSAEQGKLGEMGLIEKHLVRILTSDSISKRMNYTLTKSGVAIALNLQNISRILSSSKDMVPSSKASTNEDFMERIGECIEIGLDSFGTNLVELVKKTLETEQEIPWNQVSEKPEKLSLVFRELFGDEAAKKLETLISTNIASRFGLEQSRSGLASVISNAKKSFDQNGTEENGQKLLGGSRMKN
jgi:hypothetical protein